MAPNLLRSQPQTKHVRLQHQRQIPGLLQPVFQSGSECPHGRLARQGHSKRLWAAETRLPRHEGSQEWFQVALGWFGFEGSGGTAVDDGSVGAGVFLHERSGPKRVRWRYIRSFCVFLFFFQSGFHRDFLERGRRKKASRKRGQIPEGRGLKMW